MEPDWNESDAIWDSLPGAFEVWRLYGYFPSMRDATMSAIEVQSAVRSLRIELLYEDLSRVTDGQLLSRILMEWNGVVEATISVEDRTLYDMTFAWQEDLLMTTMNQPSHVSTIIAGSACVLSAQAIDGIDVATVARVIVR